MTLRCGQRFDMGGLSYRVVMVNDCRAHCVAVEKVPQERTDRRTGEVRRFHVRRTVEIDIAPNAAVELLGELR